MVETVMDFEQTVKTVDEMKKNAAENIALANQVRANIVALQKSVKQDVTSYSNKTCHHLTANQKRARAIEMAKEFVEEKIEETALTGELFGIETTIDTEKRKVKVEMHFAIGKQKGKAKCIKGEVFNEHIGEAIALAKALDVVEQLPPDILKAVQPTLSVGQVIRRFANNGNCLGDEVVERIKEHPLPKENAFLINDSLVYEVGIDRIIDDTNAQYETIKGGEK